MYPPWFDGLHPSRFLHINCRADNHRMQQLARRFGAKVSFDVERAVSEIETSRTTPLSWIANWYRRVMAWPSPCLMRNRAF
jgi:hypothetical protein